MSRVFLPSQVMTMWNKVRGFFVPTCRNNVSKKSKKIEYQLLGEYVVIRYDGLLFIIKERRTNGNV